MVGIIIPTMNRSQFVIRQLNYYAQQNSHHPIYIADSSSETEAKILQNEIAKLKDKLTIHYLWEKLSPYQSMAVLAQQVKEEYLCYVGDDDFQIPSFLTAAEIFLSKNPEYSCAGGQGVLITTNDEISKKKIYSIDPYPIREILHNDPIERLTDYLPNYFCAIFSVSRTSLYKRAMNLSSSIKDRGMSAELFQGAYLLAKGKLKVLPGLGVVRQTHAQRYLLPHAMEWMTQEHWSKDVRIFLEILANEISSSQNSSFEKVHQSLKMAFEGYLRRLFLENSTPLTNRKSFNQFVKETFPITVKVSHFLKSKAFGLPLDEVPFAGPLKTYPDLQTILNTF